MGYKHFSYQNIDHDTGVPEPEKDWVTEEIRQRRKNTILGIFGEGQEGKSWTLARLWENLDPTYTPSLKFHPAITGDPSTAKYCHLMGDTGPFIEALAETALYIGSEGKEGELIYPSGTKVHIDEPPDAQDWWTASNKALSGFLTRYNFTKVDVGICGILEEKTLSTIRKYMHIRIDQISPGYGHAYLMRNVKNYKKWGNPIQRKGKWSGPITDGQPPSKEWQEYYKRIKGSEFGRFARETIAEKRYADAKELKKIERLRKQGYLK